MVDIEVIRRELVDFIKESLESQARLIAEKGPICPESRREARKDMLKFSNYLENAINNSDFSAATAMLSTQKYLQDIPHDSVDFNMVAMEYLSAQLYLARVRSEYWEGKRFSLRFSEQDYNEVMSGRYRTAAEIMQAEKIHPVGELIQEYLNSPHPTWRPKTEADVRSTLDLFLQFMSPNTDIKAIHHRNLLSFRNDVLMKIPARRAVFPELRNLSLSELTKDHGKPLLALQSVNHNCVRLGGFFKWCYDHEYIDRNPATKLLIKLEGRVSNERKPYDPDDLKLILLNIREDKLSAWKPHKYWIPLISLFSGLRQAEICQLYPDNIVNIQGIPCFDIKESKERKANLKNANATRIVPIHPVLQKLGLLDFVLGRARARRGRKVEDGRLWNTLHYSPKEGYSHSFEKSYGLFNKKFITTDGKKVFHSIRHSFANNLKQRKVQESIVAEILGHSIPGMSFGRYGKAFEPKVLKEALDELDYGFNPFEILGKRELPAERIQRQIEQLPKV